MKYSAVVQELDGELYLEFPEDLIKELGWQIDDILVWKIDGETVTLSKKNELS